jgi:hypothetical protein
MVALGDAPRKEPKSHWAARRRPAGGPVERA